MAEFQGNEYNMVYQFEHWADMTISLLMKTYRFALYKGGKIIKDATTKNIKATFPGAFKKNPNYNDRVADGVKMSIFKDKYSKEAKVHIMGSRKAKSLTYKLRFFENYGTDRTKGHWRGKLPEFNFFGDAVSSTRNLALSTISRTLAETLRRINILKFN